MNEGGTVGSESEDDNNDENFNYNNALDIPFEESDYSDDFIEEEMENLLEFDHDPHGTSKKNSSIRRKLLDRKW